MGADQQAPVPEAEAAAGQGAGAAEGAGPPNGGQSGGGDGNGEAPPATRAGASAVWSKSSQHEGHSVVLQMEVVSKRQAQMIQAVVWTLVLAMLGLAIAILVLRSELHSRRDQPSRGAYYTAMLVLSAVCFAALVTAGAVFVLRWRREVLRGRRWSPHQKALTVETAVLLALQLTIAALWLVGYAVVVGASSCLFPTTAIAILGQLRATFVSTLMMWLTIMMHGMTRYDNVGKFGMLGWRRWFACWREKQQPQPEARRQQFAAAAAAAAAKAGGSCSAAHSSGAPMAAEVELGDMESEQHNGGAAAAEAAEAAGSGSSAPQAAAAALAPKVAGPSVRGQPVAGDSKSGCGSGKPIADPTGRSWASSNAADVPAPLAPPPAQLVVEQPLRVQLRLHIPKLCLWLVMEGMIVLGIARQWQTNRVTIALNSACLSEETPNCEPESTEVLGTVLVLVVYVVYLVLYFWYQYRAYEDLRSLPYVQYRLISMAIRVESQHVSVILVATLLDQFILVAAGIESCWGYLHSQLGLPPFQVCLTAMTLCSVFLYMPATTLGTPIFQAWLQEFAWTQDSLPAAKARRNRHLVEELSGVDSLDTRLLRLLPEQLKILPDGGRAVALAAERLEREPVFCFELAVRLFIWMRLAYQIKVPDTPVKQEPALALFGLQHCELFEEESTHTQAVLGWGGRGVLVLAFRGTVTMQNVITDIKLLRTWHEPRRWHNGLPVLVHSGFYNAWTGAGFSQRVLQRLDEVVAASPVAPESLTIHVTGHSLGGALAQLAAVEVRKRWPAAAVSVYTYGSPRVGNKAWAWEYDATLPDTWRIVNDEDPIPRVPKLMYSHCGHRVSVDEEGDIIVRPTHFETSVLSRTGGSVGHHLTGTYALALASIMKAQFVPSKGLPGGAEGVEALAASVDIGAAMVMRNMDLASIKDPDVPPLPIKPKPAKDPVAKRPALACLGCVTAASSPAASEAGEESEGEDGYARPVVDAVAGAEQQAPAGGGRAGGLGGGAA